MNPKASSWGARLAVAIFAAVALLAWPSRADAYAWMIRHDYTGCNQCHADPSGGGLLTAYGRAQGEVLLRTPYGAKSEEPGKIADFLFGALPLPDSVLLGGDLRYMYYRVAPGEGPATSDNFLMQSDLQGQVSLGSFRANASVGFAQKGALPAALTHAPTNNAVSRVHWLGYDFGADNEWLVRAGRMNLPFGVRSLEHTMFVRSQTRTDIDSAQQHGVSLSYNSEKWRGELMAIAGNFQLNPDDFRERGYSGYLEWSPLARLGVGASSLITHASRDVRIQSPLWRHAHGLFARWAPLQPLVLLAESDLLLNSQPADLAAGRASAANTLGNANMLQADFEATQGVHFMLTGELLNLGGQGAQPSSLAYTGWASAAWFFAPHADVRLDAVYLSQSAGDQRAHATTLVAQLHLFL